MGRGEKHLVCGSYGPIITFTLSGVLNAVVEDICKFHKNGSLIWTNTI